ncbi:BMP-binding endothelial regulator protein-like [Saccoglossus kowalevskii]|uniref:Zonadhesin-like n=1 Tax=Saccoglossus kowalevskii TaxID=10224 RepID=A0ABM0MER8_SACKO|nr:PREDICTED: zonadhesin-like [Saccoglossus kowalevskii]
MLHLLVILAAISFTLTASQTNEKSPPTYEVVYGEFTWFEAKQECEKIGGFLAEPRTPAENVKMESLCASETYWIGITDLNHEDIFTYARDDSTIIYSNFAVHQPNSWDGEQDCIQLYTDGTWNDLSCFEHLGAICQFASGCHGDPHMRTFDGRAYTFQGTCWYTLFKDCTEHSRFEITTKFEPREDSTPDQVRTRIVAFNITVGDEYSIIDGLDINTGRTDGQKTEARVITTQKKDKKIKLNFTSKNTTFTLEWTLRKHALSVTYDGSFYHGKLCGLMGNADGIAVNDFQKPDGSVAKDADEFGESWKVNGTKCY